MNKQFLWFQSAVILAVAVFSCISAFSQENVRSVEDSAFAERMRPKVAFFHDAHNEKAGAEDCALCHHVYEDNKLAEGETSEDKECSACHVEEIGEDLLGLANTYHLRCKGCHMENEKGPIMCHECHKRK